MWCGSRGGERGNRRSRRGDMGGVDVYACSRGFHAPPLGHNQEKLQPCAEPERCASSVRVGTCARVRRCELISVRRVRSIDTSCVRGTPLWSDGLGHVTHVHRSRHDFSLQFCSQAFFGGMHV